MWAGLIELLLLLSWSFVSEREKGFETERVARALLASSRSESSVVFSRLLSLVQSWWGLSEREKGFEPSTFSLEG
jgi:hypothetical protein